MGYGGGEAGTPTYYRMGDHTECVRITFDPSLTTYSDLLTVFWNSHDSTAKASKQYQSLILPLTEQQTQEATQRLASKSNSTRTQVSQAKTFTTAELKHQKYQLQRHPAMVKCLGPANCLTKSYVATRLNGYLGGRGTIQQFHEEWEELGLSQEQAEYVRKAMVRRGP